MVTISDRFGAGVAKPHPVWDGGAREPDPGRQRGESPVALATDH